MLALLTFYICVYVLPSRNQSHSAMVSTHTTQLTHLPSSARPRCCSLTSVSVSSAACVAELLVEGMPFQRAKENWIMESRQLLAGYEDELGFAPNKNKLESREQRHAREEGLLEQQDVAGTSHIKRKGVKREEAVDLQE